MDVKQSKFAAQIMRSDRWFVAPVLSGPAFFSFLACCPNDATMADSLSPQTMFMGVINVHGDISVQGDINVQGVISARCPVVVFLLSANFLRSDLV